MDLSPFPARDCSSRIPACTIAQQPTRLLATIVDWQEESDSSLLPRIARVCRLVRKLMMARLPQFKWSLSHQLIAVSAVAAFLGIWVSLGRPFAVYGALVVFVMWISEALSLGMRAFLALLLPTVALISVPLGDWPVALIAGHEYSGIINSPTSVRTVRGDVVLVFWLGLSTALLVPGIWACIRTKLFK